MCRPQKPWNPCYRARQLMSSLKERWGEEGREERRVRGGDKEQRNKEDKGKKM